MTSDNQENIHYELIGRLHRNDDQALRMIYDIFKVRIYNFGILYLKSKQEAEEVVQDAMVRLWQNRHNIDRNRQLDGYIFRIVKNLALNRLRKRVSEPSRFESIEPGLITGESVETDLLFDEMNEQINKAIDGLPQKRKEVFLLSRMEGFSNKEVAERLGISVNTVEGQIRKALIYLRTYLDLHMLITICLAAGL